MSELKDAPLISVETLEDTRRLALDSSWSVRGGMDRYRVKSAWVIALINEIEATGQYPYNAVVQREAEKRLGIPEQAGSGSSMSILVYNAQAYRRSDELIAAGFVVVTEAMMQEAFDTKRKIQAGNTMLTIRKIDGKLYAFKPRKRAWASGILGYPGKLV